MAFPVARRSLPAKASAAALLLAGASAWPLAVRAELPADLGERLAQGYACLLYTSPSPRDRQKSRMPSSA